MRHIVDRLKRLYHQTELSAFAAEKNIDPKLSINTEQELVQFLSLSFYYSQGDPQLQHWIFQFFIVKGGAIDQKLLDNSTFDMLAEAIRMPKNHAGISEEFFKKELKQQFNYLQKVASRNVLQPWRILLFRKFREYSGLRITLMNEKAALERGRFSVFNKKSILQEILIETGKENSVKKLLREQFTDLLLNDARSELRMLFAEVAQEYEELYETPLVPRELLQQMTT